MALHEKATHKNLPYSGKKKKKNVILMILKALKINVARMFMAAIFAEST